METILEQQRRFHEERERLIDAMTKEKAFQPKTHREKINSQHRFRQMMDRYIQITEELRELYEDKDGLRKQDIQALSGPNEFGVFYERCKQIKEFHRKHPGQLAVPLSVEYQKYDQIRENPEEAGAPMVEFTDEEGYGKYLDLHECHERYINLKGAPKIDYLTYIETFDRLFDFPKDKKNSSYREYIQILLDYLEGLVMRIKPLYDLTEDQSKVVQQFESQWSENKFPGWSKEAGSALSYSGAHLDLSPFTSWEELASLGLDRLKSALMALGLKCGGTLEERAQRLFATKGKPLEELDPSFFAKSKPGTKTAVMAGKKQKRDTESYKSLALLEAHVYHLVEMLGEQRAATRENVQRRQARTGAEREESDDEDEFVAARNGENGAADAEDDEDNNDVPYNPKNLPLGWDGKPIPYWLYKLHALNMYYTCEICGNQSYRGPKMFLRHFAEWRHAHGMRLLGIPNTAHFANVTKLDDALALWQKIKATKSSQRWNPEQEEEFEDSVGNVVSKKTYEDLKRQDLL